MNTLYQECIVFCQMKEMSLVWPEPSDHVHVVAMFYWCLKKIKSILILQCEQLWSERNSSVFYEYTGIALLDLGLIQPRES